ncbi:hypothetical protein MNBD_GAMMA06-469 [hydrothermal vent metagenome]|uniref:PpiC domain-containing protein n=1 Tax=hydrothermal vent metagenome TaxID=652676 RepID=A0A3B0WRE8_9ZZZZ
MRIPIWAISISVILNIVLILLFVDATNKKPITAITAPLVTTQSAKEAVIKNTVEEDVDLKRPVFKGQSNRLTQAADGSIFGPAVAIVNNVQIKQLELMPYLNEVIPAEQINQVKSFDAIPEKFLKSAIDSYAVDLLFEYLAKEKGITDNARLQAVLNKNKRRTIRTAYLSKVSPTLVNEKQVKIKYNELAKSLKGKKEYHARHILLASKKEASIIKKALLKKERSFDELAKLFSLDNSTGFKGGDLGYKVAGQLNLEFEKEISKLDLNVYSKPFKTALGWHVAVVEDRRDAKIMPYEQAVPTIRDNLQQQAVKALAIRLVKNADITLIDPLEMPATN